MHIERSRSLALQSRIHTSILVLYRPGPEVSGQYNLLKPGCNPEGQWDNIANKMVKNSVTTSCVLTGEHFLYM